MDITNIYGFMNALDELLETTPPKKRKNQYIQKVPHHLKKQLSLVKFDADTNHYRSLIQYYGIDKAYALADPIGDYFITKHHKKDNAVDQARIALKNACNENWLDLKMNLETQKESRKKLWQYAVDIIENSDYKKFQNYTAYYKALRPS